MVQDILNLSLEDFFKVIQNKENIKVLNKEIKSLKRPGYEWARLICLVHGVFSDKFSYQDVCQMYLQDNNSEYQIYANQNRLSQAVQLVIEGNEGNGYTVKKFRDEQLSKFNNGTYKVDWTVKQLLEYIKENGEANGKQSKEIIEAILGKLDGYTVNDGKVEKKMAINEEIQKAIKNGKKQIVLTGAPGTGKTHSVKKYVDEYKGKWKEKNGQELFSDFVQFHPSYDYSDFVEGLRPVQKNEQMIFERIDGRFKAFCRKVVENNNDRLNSKFKGDDKLKEGDPLFFFIIDEINRADLSKVFGELMYCLEDSYRGRENQIPTQYSNLITYDTKHKCHLDGTQKDGDNNVLDDVFKDGFYIPQNVIIIGTMNDIDKSVEAFDFALRRRFEWIDIKANVVMQNSLESMYSNALDKTKISEIVKKIIDMNKVISGDSGKNFRLSEAYHIGPAYFKGLDLTDNYTMKESLQTIFNNNIVSILKEYTRGKAEKSVNNFIGECARALGVNYEG